MKTFDKWLGNITAAVLIAIMLWAALYQLLHLSLGDIRVGGLAGSRGNPAIYEDFNP